MKLNYIEFVRMPTEKAHGTQIAHTCAALAEAGVMVTLFTHKRENPIKESLFHRYGVSENFTAYSVQGAFLPRLGPLGYFLGLRSFLKNALAYVPKGEVIYTRDPYAAFFLSYLGGYRIFYEAHNLRGRWFLSFLHLKISGIVVITKGLKQDLVKLGVPEEKVLVASDGIELKQWRLSESKFELREALGLPKEKEIVTYAGSVSLFAWKGVDTFILAARRLPQVVFLLLGGSREEIEALKKSYPASNILFIEKKRPMDVPAYLKASDVLVLPNKKGEVVSERYTSPLKLFEYMASGVPIVASDLPAIREVIAEESAWFFSANKEDDLARAVKTALFEKEMSFAKARQAEERVKEYTWRKRGEKIRDFLQSSV
ncbi:MAG: glycosyltransferase family 4 protein [Candidatus Harrisonbacteria bacterium]|nr:glycosyltransferase family 4 protein [Candidatus Harrisonbacteria bacterium]